tara:strand:- start:152 stop:1282 length:1131 start_codon:yes stop_codon:yes gene_type:complete
MAFLNQSDPDLAKAIVFQAGISRGNFHFWQPITSAFFHAGFMHIFGNMLFLLVFGPSVEDRLGRFWFLLFYMAGAILSGLAHIAADTSSAIGASGAVAAVSGAFLVLFPHVRIKCIWFFFIISIIHAPAWWLIGLFIVLDLIAEVFSPDNGIANIAHLGGYAFGAGLSLVLLLTKILPRERYDLFSLAQQRKRRSEFRVASEMHKLAGVYQGDQELDPQTADIADHRAKIGSMVSQRDLPGACELYLQMLERFAQPTETKRKGKQADTSKLLTLHRDAQYQIANHFYQSGQRTESAEAFARLLDTYPEDSERTVITVLLARIRAHDLGDPMGAIELLEELASKMHDADTQALIDQELGSVRDLIDTPTDTSKDQQS